MANLLRGAGGHQAPPLAGPITGAGSSSTLRAKLPGPRPGSAVWPSVSVVVSAPYKKPKKARLGMTTEVSKPELAQPGVSAPGNDSASEQKKPTLPAAVVALSNPQTPQMASQEHEVSNSQEVSAEQASQQQRQTAHQNSTKVPSQFRLSIYATCFASPPSCCWYLHSCPIHSPCYLTNDMCCRRYRLTKIYWICRTTLPATSTPTSLTSPL